MINFNSEKTKKRISRIIIVVIVVAMAVTILLPAFV